MPFIKNLCAKHFPPRILLAGLCASIIFSCKKDESPALAVDSNADFAILEQVGDTLLPTDTCYAFRKVRFEASKDFFNYNWYIGSNKYTLPSFDLVFSESDDILVKLSGLLKNKKDTTISKRLVIYQPQEVVSPLVGNFKGSNTDNTSEAFTVKINYWFGSRYPWWSDGAYSITNLPNGYSDSTQNFNGNLRPEIKGIISSTGYSNMAFEKNGNIAALGINGYASLHRGLSDTLVVNYKILDMVEYNSNGSIHYLNKKFIGIRQ